MPAATISSRRPSLTLFPMTVIYFSPAHPGIQRGDDGAGEVEGISFADWLLGVQTYIVHLLVMELNIEVVSVPYNREALIRFSDHCCMCRNGET